MTASLATSILVVDDDLPFRERLTRALADRGFDVRAAANPEQALESARSESPELAIVDLRMPGGSGLDVVGALTALDPATRIVVLTGYGSIATAVEAVRRGAVDYLSKPADVDEILARFARDGDRPPEPVPEDASVPSLARVEWEHINRILTDCDGNVSQAARLLGLHRRSLQRKLAKRPVER
ncbi:MAG: response regulator [Myxococcales bacterium]|nr:response regulator [Myxococcales bacterium]